jgi:hypothetical protein|tara:strand:- start:389 stop:667 length:279 start_codon:yes stop_codon:yes gene_type:complete
MKEKEITNIGCLFKNEKGKIEGLIVEEGLDWDGLPFESNQHQYIKVAAADGIKQIDLWGVGHFYEDEDGIVSYELDESMNDYFYNEDGDLVF